jgi:hypothetical protein
MIKQRRLRWEKHVGRMVERRGTYVILVGKTKVKDNLGELGVDGRMILTWIF